MFIVPNPEGAVFQERHLPHGSIHVNFYDSPYLLHGKTLPPTV